jgi:hypothetical protein
MTLQDALLIIDEYSGPGRQREFSPVSKDSSDGAMSANAATPTVTGGSESEMS